MSERTAQADREEVRSALASLISACTVGASRLESLLDEELAALRAQEPEQLEAVAASKLTLVEELNSLEARRQAIAVHAGFGSTGHDMAELLSWCSDDSALTDAWQALLGILERCDQGNRRNGAIACVRREQVRGAMALLSGNFDGVAVYDPAGKEAVNVDHRELARA